MEENHKNYMVVGSTSGIGLATNSKLLAAGHRVFGVSRKPVSNIFGENYFHLDFDVRAENFQPFSDHLPEALDGLVYCPGSITLKPFSRLSRQDFLDDFEINVVSAARCLQAALPSLKKGAPSAVVLFSTVATSVGMNFHASISAAKSALEGLALSLAAEFASFNIRINVIAPSITRTPLAQNLLSSEDKVKASANRHPIKQIGEPEDLATTTAFLLSPEASWITGQIIHVDGGLSNLKPL